MMRLVRSMSWCLVQPGTSRLLRTHSRRTGSKPFRHRLTRYVPRTAFSVPLPGKTRGIGDQYLRAPVLPADGVAGTRVCRQSRRRHGHPGTGHGMGPRRDPGKFYRARPHCRHRGHAKTRADPVDAGCGGRVGAAWPGRNQGRHRPSGLVSVLFRCGLHPRSHYPGRWRLVARWL